MKKIDILKFIRSDIAEMESYVPGTSINDLAEKFGQKPEDVIKLNSNENPYGPSPLVKKSLPNLLTQYYPGSSYKELREKIADYAGVKKENIIVGSGSDELIDLLLRAVIRDGDKIINTQPTFDMYKIFSRLNRAEIVDAERGQDFRINTTKIVKASKDDRVKIIFLCNPNNPTGTLTSQNEIRSILDTDKLVFVDEAYYEFSKQTIQNLFGKYNNLIILRTFSKWAGLAGLRIGYAIMAPELVNELLKIKSPFNVNTAAEAAAIATLQDLTYAKKSIEIIIKERQKMFEELVKIPSLKVYPSSANFVFIQTSDNDYEPLRHLFEKNKIALRYLKSKFTGNGIRITIGKPEQNKKVLGVLMNFFNIN